VHAFLAADRHILDAATRIDLADGILRRYGVDRNLDPIEVADAGTRLWTWLERDLGSARLYREWPVAQQLEDGSIVNGIADIVARSRTGLTLVDHKTFPGTLEAALIRLSRYSGQLTAYASCISSAMGMPVTSMWVHLPVLGVAVPVVESLE